MALDFGAQVAYTCGYDARWLSRVGEIKGVKQQYQIRILAT